MLDIIGYISTGVSVFWVIVGVVVCVRYLIPVAKRFGLGMWRRQIAIVSDNSTLAESLKIDLASTGILRRKNIVTIPRLNVKDLPKWSVVVIDCECFDSDELLDDFIRRMDVSIGVVLYCRAGRKRLSDDLMNEINGSSRVILTNFRGRLVNDVIASLVSTPYEEKRIK